MNLKSVITNSKNHFSFQWKEKYGSFLEEEHWSYFVSKMVQYIENGTPFVADLPKFEEEIRVSEKEIEACFQEVIPLSPQENNAFLSEKWAKSIENTPFEYILAIIGQRFTSASLKNEEAIPPLRKTLIKSSFAAFNSQISKATREWEKHVGRHENNFWGTVKGNPKQKEETVKKLILDMLETKTWWNIFYHYKHGLVYEIRVASGHGIRWSKSGTKLIGFLEDFLSDESE